MNGKETREDRLAAALRDNLRRRKARARGEDAAGSSAATTGEAEGLAVGGAQGGPTALHTNGTES